MATKQSKELQPGDEGYVAPVETPTSADVTAKQENPTIGDNVPDEVKVDVPAVEQPTQSPQPVEATTGIDTPSNTIGTEVVNNKPVAEPKTGIAPSRDYDRLLAAYTKLKERVGLDHIYAKQLDAEAGLV